MLMVNEVEISDVEDSKIGPKPADLDVQLHDNAVTVDIFKTLIAYRGEPAVGLDPSKMQTTIKGMTVDEAGQLLLTVGFTVTREPDVSLGVSCTITEENARRIADVFDGLLKLGRLQMDERS